MAEFGNLAQDIMGIIDTCAGGMDRNDAAAFLIAQQDMLQAGYAESRQAGKASQAAGKPQGDMSGSQDAKDALAKLNSMMKNLK